MHRGFSLVELLAASAVLTVVLLMGYRYCDGQRALTAQMLSRTRPEAESTYRMLLIRTFYSDAAGAFRKDPMLAAAPAVFPDLRFGQEPADDSFSVARASGEPLPFVREGTLLRVPGGALAPDMIVLVAGPGADDSFDWDYVRVDDVIASGDFQLLRTTSLAGRTLPLHGTLIPVELHGIAYRNGALYRVHPSGQTSPITAVRDFHSEWDGTFLSLRWTAGPSPIAFKVRP